MPFATDPATYRRLYGDLTKDNPLWDAIPTTRGDAYVFDDESTYIAEPPFFEGFTMQPGVMPGIIGARALCIFGDGSVGEGEFHEALNLAVLWQTPVVFFCENNLYGMGVPFKESLSTDIPKLAAAYNMPGRTVSAGDDDAAAPMSIAIASLSLTMRPCPKLIISRGGRDSATIGLNQFGTHL